jgi:BMFP domain-containing protein YqiC
MNSTSSRVFDEIAKLMGNAAGAAQGMRRELDNLVKSQIERAIAGMDVVTREEFEIVKDMASKARTENEALTQKIAELEAKLSQKD